MLSSFLIVLSSNTVYVDTTDTQLRDLFAKQGTVELVSIPRDRETGTSKGFAFVDMSSPEEVTAAVSALHQTDYGGRSLRVQASLPKDEAQKQAKKKGTTQSCIFIVVHFERCIAGVLLCEDATTVNSRTNIRSKSLDVGMQKLYVGNLSFDSTKEDVQKYFAKFGDVKEVYLPVNANTGSPRGFAFVTLDEAVAAEAIAETDGKEFQGRTLVVSMPLPRGEKIVREQRPRKFRKLLLVLYIRGILCFCLILILTFNLDAFRWPSIHFKISDQKQQQRQQHCFK